mmetsp:Transcript_40377/g.93662  ORF Transcript_40377/g.93662 Transcript_40377/m.93662 type:complete len:87 (-) Transcript_40377:1471-1731(-)
MADHTPQMPTRPQSRSRLSAGQTEFFLRTEKARQLYFVARHGNYRSFLQHTRAPSRLVTPATAPLPEASQGMKTRRQIFCNPKEPC